MIKLLLNNIEFVQDFKNVKEIEQYIAENIFLDRHEYYLAQNGKILSPSAELDTKQNVYCQVRVLGGKGGFGSMLRAIGAQIEKTTNREACRDLSGRRLRDINEEKRLKAWLEKQGEREREAEERKKRKVEKLLSVPKHEFKDEDYEKTRSAMTDKVSDAVEEGFKKSQIAKSNTDIEKTAVKRNSTSINTTKKKKPSLWIGDDISDTDGSESNSSEDEKELPIKKSKLTL